MSVNMMKAVLQLTVLCLGLSWPGSRASSKRRDIGEIPECVTVRSTTRPSSYGYDHVVYVRNGCTVTVECQVGTHPHRKAKFGLVVPPGMEKGVVTGTHEKKPQFSPWVDCTRRAKASVPAGTRLHGSRDPEYGRELGRLGIHEFVNAKTVYVAAP